MGDLGRIQKELADFRKVDVSGIKIEQDVADPRHLVGIINGPSDTAYDGGIFRVDINIPSDYPFSPPKMKFITKVISYLFEPDYFLYLERVHFLSVCLYIYFI